MLLSSGDCDFCLYKNEHGYFLEVPILVGQIVWSRTVALTKIQFELFLVDDTPAIIVASQQVEQGSKEARSAFDRLRKQSI